MKPGHDRFRFHQRDSPETRGAAKGKELVTGCGQPPQTVRVGLFGHRRHEFEVGPRTG